MSPRRVVVELGGRVVADTVRAVRVCETSHPPVYYIPREDVADGVLEPAQGGSWCEWRGEASYWEAVVDGHRVPAVGWSYEDPSPASSCCAAQWRSTREGSAARSSTAHR